MSRRIAQLLDNLNERSTSAPGEITLADKKKGWRVAIWTTLGQIGGFLVGVYLAIQGFIGDVMHQPDFWLGVHKLFSNASWETIGVALGGVVFLAVQVYGSYRAELERTKRNDNRGPQEPKEVKNADV